MPPHNLLKRQLAEGGHSFEAIDRRWGQLKKEIFNEDQLVALNRQLRDGQMVFPFFIPSTDRDPRLTSLLSQGFLAAKVARRYPGCGILTPQPGVHRGFLRCWTVFWPSAASLAGHGAVVLVFAAILTSADPLPLPHIQLPPPAPVPPLLEISVSQSPEATSQKPAIARGEAQAIPTPQALAPLITNALKIRASLPMIRPKPALVRFPRTVFPAPFVVSEVVSEVRRNHVDTSTTPLKAATPSDGNEGELSAASTSAGPPPDYIDIVRTRLEKYKHYPSEARASHEEGIAILGFTLDRDGHVVAWHLAGSSGSPVLDQETTELIQRASPFPAFPSEFTDNSMSIVVPIEFSLKNN